MYIETSKMYQKLLDKETGLLIRDTISLCLSVLLIILILLLKLTLIPIILLIISTLYFTISVFRLVMRFKSYKKYNALYKESCTKEKEVLDKCPYFIDSDGTHYYHS